MKKIRGERKKEIQKKERKEEKKETKKERIKRGKKGKRAPINGSLRVSGNTYTRSTRFVFFCLCALKMSAFCLRLSLLSSFSRFVLCTFRCCGDCQHYSYTTVKVVM